MKTRITRISQIMGNIVPEPEGDTFEKAKDIVLRWLHKKISNPHEEHKDKTHYQFSDNRGQSAEHLTFEVNDGQKVWILSYSHPCNVTPTRRWVTEAAIAINPNGGLTFGLRLNAHDSNLDSGVSVSYSVPNLIKDLAEELMLISDGKRVLPVEEQITDQSSGNTDEIDSLVDNIYREDRRQPIIVVAQDKNGCEALDASRLARQLVGIAHVYSIDFQSSYILTGKLGRNLATYNGAVRLYPPIVNGTVNNRHLYLPDRTNGILTGYNVRNIINQTFLLSREYAADENAFPSFASIKKFYFENVRQKLNQEPASTSAPDTRDRIITAQAQEIAALKSELDEAFSLAAEEEQRRITTDNEMADMRRTLEDTVQQLKDLPSVNLLKKGALFPNLSMLQDWAKEHFPEELLITKRAQKSALRSVFADTNLIYQGLIFLAREYRNFVLFAEMGNTNGGVRNLRREQEERLNLLRLENRISIREENAKMYKDEYYASHDGKKYFLNMHLAKGAARDPKRCLRIYYTFDNADARIVVGHLPSHLKNQLT